VLDPWGCSRRCVASLVPRSLIADSCICACGRLRQWTVERVEGADLGPCVFARVDFGQGACWTSLLFILRRPEKVPAPASMEKCREALCELGVCDIRRFQCAR
jgi:hypothetical protein